MSGYDQERPREPMHTGLVAPRGRWWVPAHKSEKVWFAIATEGGDPGLRVSLLFPHTNSHSPHSRSVVIPVVWESS